jgi:hypothetical protein
MSSTKLFLFTIGISLFVASCKTPKYASPPHVSQKISTGYGPEDIILDITGGAERILISSANRSSDKKGNIQALNLKTNEVITLARTKEPDSIRFYPHGMDMIVGRTGIKYLYVISHEENKDLVLRYKVLGDQLEFMDAFHDKLFTSLNDVTLDGDDGFFVSNDHFRKGNVVHCNKFGDCNVVANKLGFANGLHKQENKLYVATTVGSRIHEITLGEDLSMRKITRIKGADNLTYHEGKLLTVSHPCFLRFFRHVKKNSRRSPTKVYQIDPASNSKELLFSDNGRKISAGSTAIIYQNKLYIGQVFNPYILVIDLEKVAL